MLKKNADKCDTDKVKLIDLTESEPPEGETNSECEEQNKTEEEEIKNWMKLKKRKRNMTVENQPN